MTLYIVFAYLRDGRLDMDTKLTVSKTAAKRPPSKIGFKPGDSLSVRARSAAGDQVRQRRRGCGRGEHRRLEAAFARLMTRKARAMGMKDTTFRNASGLPHSEPENHRV